MQNRADFNNGGTGIGLGVYWMQCFEFCLTFLVIRFTAIFAYRIVRLLMVLKKIDKKLSGRLELSTSLVHVYI